MTVGVVANSAWNVFNFRRNLIVSFLKKGYEVIVFAPDSQKYKQKLEEIGCLFQSIELENKGTDPVSDAKFIFSLVRLYRSNKVDIALHFTVKPNIYGSIASKILGVPCINNVTGLGTVFLHHNVSTRLAKLLYKFSFRIPRHIFFQNKDDYNLFIQEKIITDENSVSILPGSGVDLNHFSSKSSFKKNSKFHFLMVSRLLYDKGIIEYVEAAKNILNKKYDARFQLLGNLEEAKGLGVSKMQLDEWIDQGIVEYLGVTDDVRPYIENADCVVLPSYREGTPRSLLEGASMSKPLIATNVPGCKEVINDGINGYLCDVKSSSDLSEKFELLLKLTNDKLETMGEKSRELAVERFDQQIVSNSYLEEIKKTIHR